MSEFYTDPGSMTSTAMALHWAIADQESFGEFGGDGFNSDFEPSNCSVPKEKERDGEAIIISSPERLSSLCPNSQHSKATSEIGLESQSEFEVDDIQFKEIDIEHDELLADLPISPQKKKQRISTQSTNTISPEENL